MKGVLWIVSYVITFLSGVATLVGVVHALRTDPVHLWPMATAAVGIFAGLVAKELYQS